MNDFDTLLTELRALVTAWPDDAVVREQFAMSLVAAYDASDPSRCDGFLAELRALATDWPQDADVRAHLSITLAKALAKMIQMARLPPTLAADD